MVTLNVWIGPAPQEFVAATLNTPLLPGVALMLFDELDPVQPGGVVHV